MLNSSKLVNELLLNYCELWIKKEDQNGLVNLFI